MTETTLTSPIVILGAGYSGTLTAANLLRASGGKQQQVMLVDRHAPFGRGLAYRCRDDNLLLNVPAGNMSALADAPEHFVAYCQTIDPAFNTGSFISRRIYGDYLEHTLAQAERDSDAVLHRICGEAIAVRPRTDTAGFLVELADGRSIEAGQVVLALGHFPPRNPQPDSAFLTSDAYIGNPWDFAALDRIPADRPVLVLGAGHTAVDALFRLTSSSERKVSMLSRRGLLPHGHRFTPKPPTVAGFPPYLENVPHTIRAYVRALRREAKARMSTGGDWRDVINELRPHTPDIWRKLPVAERRKFLTRVVAFWDIHRHRLAPSADRRLRGMQDTGQVEIVAGRVLAYEQQGDTVKVSVRQRHDGSVREFAVGAVVNCTGPTYDLAALTLPLIVQLRNDGLLQQDPLKIGLEVDEQYQVIDRQGQPVPRLFYVGPMLKAKYWEAIAIPELRGHTLKLAKQILAK